LINSDIFLLVLLAGGLAGYGVHELAGYTGADAWGLAGAESIRVEYCFR